MEIIIDIWFLIDTELKHLILVDQVYLFARYFISFGHLYKVYVEHTGI